MTDSLNETRIGDNLIVSTHYDDDPQSTIRGWHRRMVIGDGPNIDSEDYDGWDDMIASIVKDEEVIMIAPLYWYEHSGASCKMGSPFTPNTPNHDQELTRFRSECMDDAGWDSGVAGLVYVTAKSQANVGCPDDLIVKGAESEVETYDQWMRGMVYGYTVTIESDCDHGDTHADTLDSCWGFIGDDEYAMSEGMAFVGWAIASALRLASKLDTFAGNHP